MSSVIWSRSCLAFCVLSWIVFVLSFSCIVSGLVRSCLVLSCRGCFLFVLFLVFLGCLSETIDCLAISLPSLSRFCFLSFEYYGCNWLSPYQNRTLSLGSLSFCLALSCLYLVLQLSCFDIPCLVSSFLFVSSLFFPFLAFHSCFDFLPANGNGKFIWISHGWPNDLVLSCLVLF